MSSVGFYIRVSTPGQIEPGTAGGEQMQLDECIRIAKYHELELPEELNIEPLDHSNKWRYQTTGNLTVIAEQGSGAYIERPGLNKLIELIFTKEIDTLITFDLDRIARDHLGIGTIVRDVFQEMNLTVFTRTGPISYSDTDELVTMILGWTSAAERKKIRARTMAGKKSTAKAQNVLPTGTGPGLFGYDYKARNKSENAPQKRIINQLEAQTVKRAFNMAMEGLGVNTIARTFNDEGIRTKLNKNWHSKTIKTMLNNPAYTGITRYGVESVTLQKHGKRDRRINDPSEVMIIEGFTPAIIDHATFEKVQIHLNRPRRSGRAHEPYMLARMLRCGHCGTPMVGQKLTPRGRTYWYYTCRGTSPTATRGAICNAKRNQTKSIDERVQKAIYKFASDPQFISTVLADKNKALASNATSLEDAELQNRLREIEREQKNLIDAIKSAPSATGDLVEEIELLGKERNEIKQLLASQAPVIEGSTITEYEIKEFQKALRESLKTERDAEAWHSLLSSLMFEIELFEDGRANSRISVPTEVNRNHHCTNIGASPNLQQQNDSISYVMVPVPL